MNSISFIGGDVRNLFLSKMYSSQFDVNVYGLFDSKCNIEECVDKSRYIVLPIPFSIDGEHLYMPLSNKSVSIEHILSKLKNKVIITGNIEKKFMGILEDRGNSVIDMMKNIDVVIKNTIPTAEGVIKIIVENTETTISGSNIAIIGFGRVGKKIGQLLNRLNANIYAFDIKKEEVANIKLCSYNVLEDLYKNMDHMDIIINTVPKLVINKNVLDHISKDKLIIDVASKPGGVDYEYAKVQGYNVIHALGLPGKIAPKTVAMFIKEEIDKIMI